MFRCGFSPQCHLLQLVAFSAQYVPVQNIYLCVANESGSPLHSPDEIRG